MCLNILILWLWFCGHVFLLCEGDRLAYEIWDIVGDCDFMCIVELVYQKFKCGGFIKWDLISV